MDSKASFSLCFLPKNAEARSLHCFGLPQTIDDCGQTLLLVRPPKLPHVQKFIGINHKMINAVVHPTQTTMTLLVQRIESRHKLCCTRTNFFSTGLFFTVGVEILKVLRPMKQGRFSLEFPRHFGGSCWFIKHFPAFCQVWFPLKTECLDNYMMRTQCP